MSLITTAQAAELAPHIARDEIKAACQNAEIEGAVPFSTGYKTESEDDWLMPEDSFFTWADEQAEKKPSGLLTTAQAQQLAEQNTGKATPLSTISWACRNGHIKGAEKICRDWLFSEDAFLAWLLDRDADMRKFWQAQYQRLGKILAADRLTAREFGINPSTVRKKRSDGGGWVEDED